MEEFIVLKGYQTKYPDPIILKAGDIVELGREEEKEDWKGWIWAIKKDKEGWIPMQIVKICGDGLEGEILESYSANELNVRKDDRIQKIRSLNGWSWCLNIATKSEGWIPNEIIGQKLLINPIN
ncbi:SH3 domain-containing protein [Xanthovirga aplysinae]|uniref:SH3 domain-containing protein n=1 Tax=Xanthovirga aplysinae TaxID=2529853 RepID=UPI0012BCE8E7|nr:SH3 domain-containing protein [Xanthovirga aplysinae]MTI32252.1 hypothetical protein [Xanthovirga aplysinae]